MAQKANRFSECDIVKLLSRHCEIAITSSVMHEGRNLSARMGYNRRTDSDKLRPRAQWCVRARLRDWFCTGVMCDVVAGWRTALTPVSRLQL